MRILISGLAYDDGKSGISEYIQKVVEELSHLARIDLIMLQGDIEGFPVKNDSIRFIPVSNRYNSPILSMLYHLYVLPGMVKKWKSRYDFMFLPAGNRRIMAYYPLKTVVTIHDLSQFHIPLKYDRFRMFYITHLIPRYLVKADIIISVSEQTKKDLLQYYHIPKKKIIVNHNGFSPDKFKESSQADTVIAKYSLAKPYLLYISRIEHPGKNHLNLIKAYELLPDEFRNKVDLVLGGSDWNGSENVHRYAEHSKAMDGIKFLGYVPNTDLKALYERCELYIFPSLWEGFGLSLLEAMACSAPVICSNCSSLPEVGGNAVLTFDPKDPWDIRNKIVEVMGDRDLREEMIRKGYERLKEFSWEKHAKTIVN